MTGVMDLQCYFANGFGSLQASVSLCRYKRSHEIDSVSPNNDSDSPEYLVVEVFLGNSLFLLESLHLTVLHNLLEGSAAVLLWYLRIWSDDFGKRLAVAC